MQNAKEKANLLVQLAQCESDFESAEIILCYPVVLSFPFIYFSSSSSSSF